MSEQQWEEIRIEDVQPGDVARCNGREFRVMPTCEGSRRKWYVNLGSYQMADYDLSTIGALGFTLWRKVKREPRAFDAEFNCIEFDGQVKVAPDCVLIPSAWHHGTRVRVTEILDGEDGA